jgi:1-deoxyxylulose-5-phosphate synthase
MCAVFAQSETIMDHVRFGKTGMKVSRLCLGCMTYGSTKWRDWVLEEEASQPFFREAIERGINFFDTADVYSLGVSEEITGRALKTFAKRHEVVLATKVHGKMGDGANSGGLSRKHIMEGIDHSLKRLGTDYVDLYQIHRFDPATPMEETLEALDDVVRAGKALYVGASSMYSWQFAKMIAISRARGHAQFVSMQNFYNLIYREEEREMMPLCVDEGIAVIPWSPIARGYLAGSGVGQNAATTRGRSDAFSVALGLGSPQDEEIRLRVVEVARDLGSKPAVVALAWVLSKPYVTAPIIGASKPHHLEDATAALALKLDAETIAKLEAPYKPKAVVGHV